MQKILKLFVLGLLLTFMAACVSEPEYPNEPVISYIGHPTSKTLKNVDGETIKNLDVLMNCLEAGEEAYNQRNTMNYEILKDR